MSAVPVFRLRSQRRLEPIEACPSCGNAHVETVSHRIVKETTLAARWGLLEPGDRLAYVMCRACGLVFANPRYAAETLDEYYRDVCPANVEWLPSDHATNPQYRARERLRFQITFEQITRVLGRIASVADVGGLDGASLVPFLEGGAREAILVDPGAESRKLADSRIAMMTSLGQLVASGRRVQALLCLQTVEHVREPLGFVRALSEALEPGGALVCELPFEMEVDSFYFDPASPIPDGFHPEHLNFFTPTSARALLEDAGLEVARVDVRPMVYAYGGYPATIVAIARKRDGGRPSRRPTTIARGDVEREVRRARLLLRWRRRALRARVLLHRLRA